MVSIEKNVVLEMGACLRKMARRCYKASGISRYGFVLIAPVSSSRMEELLIGYRLSRDFHGHARFLALQKIKNQ